MLSKRTSDKLSSCWKVDETDVYLLEEERNFIKSLNVVFYSIVHCPFKQSISSLSLRGVKSFDQDESYQEIIQIMKSDLKSLSFYYGDGFEEIFKLIKGCKYQVKGNVIMASQELTQRMVDKEIELEEENESLKISILQMRKRCLLLKKIISSYQQK